MIELPPALAIEADLLDLGMSKHNAASLVSEYEAGNLPGLGLFVGRVAHFGRGERFVRDAIREGWYRDWKPSQAEVTRRKALSLRPVVGLSE
jgi:hypothetical protein